MNEDDAGSVAIALAGLKGSVDTGFARMNGRLDVALQRQETTDRELKDLKRKIATLEAKMYKLALTAALIGGGGATGAWQLIGQ